MKKILTTCCSIIICLLAAHAQVSVTNLLTENKTNPTGIDAISPRFSWQVQSNQRNTMQTAYEL
ncbi:MAG: hypothetical protein JSU05_13875, partial [Bacteroidetes bacterium]|nr:hypothetical protein [Bacteroidota bacterium]